MTTLRASISKGAPRVVALIWAAYDVSRILAYVDTVPKQLEGIAAVLPFPLWALWAVAALLLALGALVPKTAPPAHMNTARHMRTWGIILTSALLALWGFAFITADFARGWVTASSYIMLVASAWGSGFILSREVASVQAARDR